MLGNERAQKLTMYQIKIPIEQETCVYYTIGFRYSDTLMNEVGSCVDGSLGSLLLRLFM